jgi:riboflavin synthase
MFTGIIFKLGKLKVLEKKKEPLLTIDVDKLEGVKIGDSIAVNGACLTLVAQKQNFLTFNLSSETLNRSNFNDLSPGTYVNVELPLKLNDLLSGHLVSGHLDGVVRVKAIQKNRGSTAFSFIYQDRDWKKFLIHKGSVTLNGVSLTLIEVKNSFFSVEVIPHTLENTNFKFLKIGERVNLELDLIGKYLYNLTYSKR